MSVIVRGSLVEVFVIGVKARLLFGIGIASNSSSSNWNLYRPQVLGHRIGVYQSKPWVDSWFAMADRTAHQHSLLRRADTPSEVAGHPERTAKVTDIGAIIRNMVFGGTALARGSICMNSRPRGSTHT